MSWDDGIEGATLAFAGSNDRLLRSLAGPGTGKTFALIRRVARLLEEGVEPDRILVLTFARTAAQDLVRSLAQLGEQGYAAVPARTLHSFCFALLGREQVLAATGRVPRILLDFEKDDALLDLSGPFGGIRKRRTMATAFEAAWARRQTDHPGEPVEGLDQRFQDALRSWLRWHRGMLVGELVPEALSYIRLNPMSGVGERYEHVLVDEYQDLNRAEQELVDLLGANSLAVIGDDDQSIYSFKWANPEGIREFGIRHPGTHDVPLEECRRCPTKVVELALALLARDATRPGDHQITPFAGNPEGEVHSVQWGSIEAEAEGIATYLSAMIDRGAEEGQCLVLAPRRAIGYAIREALGTRGIEADTYFREQPVESERAQEALTLITLLISPGDRVAQRAWLGFGSSHRLSRGYRRAWEAARTADCDVFEILSEVSAGTRSLSFSGALVKRWQLFDALRQKWQPLLDVLPDFVDGLLPDSDEDVSQLRNLALAVLEEEEPDPDRFLFQMRSAISQPEVPIVTPRVRIMSFHRSKGLMAEVVVLAGLVSGLMPQAQSERDAPYLQAAQLAEQRRLFYVGMTRTRRALVFSCEYELPAPFVQRNRLPRGRWTGSGYRTYPSPFLAELGPTMPASIRGDEWTY